jgi:hypothetical protein
MRNITRIGDGDGTAWQVAIRRGSPLRRYCKMFSDSRYMGDAEAALAAAQAWRDVIEERHPKQTLRDRFMRPGKNNASGHCGVYRVVVPRRHGDPSAPSLDFWQATTPAWITPRRRRSFSIAKYGDEEAFRRAIAARQQFERDAGAAVDVPVSPKAIGRKPPELRCILRLQRACGAVWRVSIARGTPLRRFRKHFPDQSHGGTAQALAAAQAWRDEIERQHPRPSRSQLAKGLNTRNTSGKAGVSRTAKPSRHVDGSATVTDYWLAKSPRGLKPARSRIFSVSKHGEQEAYRLAVEARLAFEAMLDEAPR